MFDFVCLRVSIIHTAKMNGLNAKRSLHPDQVYSTWIATCTFFVDFFVLCVKLVFECVVNYTFLCSVNE
jgi:hypothetical protein